jgi:tRNA pseudouridine38-40 synthase
VTSAGGDAVRRLALVVEYDGARYHGFQLQRTAPTVQAELEKAIERLTGEVTRIKAASRTDAGGHARGQVVAFDTRASHDTQTWAKALNALLPDDVAVRGVYQAPAGFDPRRRASSRVYRYTIVNAPTPSPLLRRTAHWIRTPLDAERMALAARTLVGVHDVAAFTVQVARTKSTVRRMYRWEVWREGDLVIMEAEANAFLMQQVRRTAGALTLVGMNKMTLEEFGDLVEGRAAGPAGPLLPARGLCLERVVYPDFPPRLELNDA